MASKQMIIVFTLVVVAFAPSIALAKEFIVGDGTGWTIGFNYQAWAQGKEFHVGDKLVFQYPVGAHNVHKVNGTDFQACTVPLEAEPLKTGNDIITLATPGRKWYICGVGKHCESGGQKLFITVLAAESAAAPAPSPMQSSANVVALSGFQMIILAIVFVTMVFMA